MGVSEALAALLFPIFGGLIGFALLRVFGFRGFVREGVLVGVLTFFIAILIQSPVQQLPLLLHLISVYGPNILTNTTRVVEYVLAQGALFIALLSLWMGFAAAALQSGLKLLFVRGRSSVYAVSVGVGFGFVEALFIGVNGMLAMLFTVENVSSPLAHLYVGFMLSAIGRLFALLFHTGSTLLIFSFWKKGKWLQGLLITIAIHTAIDTLATAYQLTKGIAVLAIAEATAGLAGLCLVLAQRKTLAIR